MKQRIQQIQYIRPKRGDRWKVGPKAIHRAFRLMPECIESLEELAERFDCSQAVVIEALVKGACNEN